MRTKAILFALFWACSSSASAAPLYTFTDLGTLGGSSSRATAINEAGAIVGDASKAGDIPGSFVRPPGGPMQSFVDNFVGRGINNSGIVAGTYNARAATWQAGTIQSLGTLGGNASFGFAINDAGFLTGTARLAGVPFQSHAFLSNGGPLEDLGTLGGTISTGLAINASGTVVGESTTAGGPDNHAFVKHIGSPMQDLGTLGGITSTAYGINDNGDVVGSARLADNSTRAFLYTGGTMQSLGTFSGNSTASDINNSGVIVGDAATAEGTIDAFVYRDGFMLNLNDYIPVGTSMHLVQAIAINDAGQIVGYGYYPSSTSERAFLLTPIAVPEPSTLTLAALGLAWFVFRRSRRTSVC